MAARYTTVLAALLAVLSSGTRRKPDYIRQQALVSLLYPYLPPAETLWVQDSIYAVDVIFIEPPIEYGYSESIQVVDSIYQVFVRTPIQEYKYNESLQVENNIYTVYAKDVLRTYAYTESLQVQNSIYTVSAPSVGIYYAYSEELSVINSIYQIYAGPIS